MISCHADLLLNELTIPPVFSQAAWGNLCEWLAHLSSGRHSQHVHGVGSLLGSHLLLEVPIHILITSQIKYFLDVLQLNIFVIPMFPTFKMLFWPLFGRESRLKTSRRTSIVLGCASWHLIPTDYWVNGSIIFVYWLQFRKRLHQIRCLLV